MPDPECFLKLIINYCDYCSGISFRELVACNKANPFCKYRYERKVLAVLK